MTWRRRLAAIARPPSPLEGTPLGNIQDDATTRALAESLQAAGQRRLGRSLAIAPVDGGSCNGCELEIRMLAGVVYDLQRYGLRLVDSPRHADVLLVTGQVTRNMHVALRLAWEAMPDPKWVIAIGDCAIDGGVFKGSPAIIGGIDGALPVDLTVRGCPPTPAQILAGLRSLLEANARG